MTLAHTAIQWGNVPAWASAVLTSISLLLALYLMLRDRQRDIRAQASRTSAYLLRLGTSRAPGPWVICYINRSDTPVVDVQVEVADPRAAVIERRSVPTLPPLSEISSDPLDSQALLTPECRVAISFTDNSGIRWQRTSEGQLKRVSMGSTA